MKIKIKRKNNEEKKLEGTPEEIIEWIKDNLSLEEQEEFIEGVRNNKISTDTSDEEANELDCLERELMIRNRDKLDIRGMIECFGERRPKDKFKDLGDGKVEIPLKLNEETGRKLDAIGKKADKTPDELVEKLLIDKVEHDSNIDCTNINGLYELFEIPENDRLKNFQIIKKILTNSYNSCLEDIKEGTEEQKKSAEREYPTFKYFINPVLKELKIFELDDEVVPMLSLQDFDEQKSPFSSLGIDCNVWLEHESVKRLYLGFIIGSYYTEDNIHYRCVITVFAEKDDKGELRTKRDMFILEKDLCKKLIGRTAEKQFGKVRRFIYSFLNYINSPEVTIRDLPHNPKNNKRREERGRIPLPPTSKIYIHGSQLRRYVDEVNEGIKKFGYSHRFEVRGHYEHFWNKKKYNKIYSTSKEGLKKKGYEITPDGVIRKFKKAFWKGQGLVVKKEYKVIK